MISINHFGQKNIEIDIGHYATNGRLAVHLVSGGEPYATVSVNLPAEDVGRDEFVFKTYSENEGLYEELIRTGVIEFTGRRATGDIGPLPICRVVNPESHLHVAPAVERALDAFWQAVAELWPDAKTGDLSPERTVALDDAARAAIAEWYLNNRL